MNQQVQNKNEFIKLLQSTERDDVDYVIEDIERLGFFDAPASSRFHLNYDGGLCEHSLNVCKVALRLRDQMIDMKPELEALLPKDSVIVASLLHDVCKANYYQESTRNVKNKETGRWEEVPFLPSGVRIFVQFGRIIPIVFGL